MRFQCVSVLRGGVWKRKIKETFSMRFRSRFWGGCSGSGTFPETLFAYRSATKAEPAPGLGPGRAQALLFARVRYL